MLEMHPEYEDYYFNIEKIIIARVGMEIRGKMHTARSRNDLGSTMLRMNVRDTLMKIIPMVYELEKVLLMVLIAAAFTYMCVEMNTLVYRRRESQYNGPGGGGGRDRMRAGDHPPYLRKYPADHCTASSWVRTLCS